MHVHRVGELRGPEGPADLIESGEIAPAIDRTYPLSQTPAAIRHVQDGRARGKVVITIERTALPRLPQIPAPVGDHRVLPGPDHGDLCLSRSRRQIDESRK